MQKKKKNPDVFFRLGVTFFIPRASRTSEIITADIM